MNKLPSKITDEEWLKTPGISTAVQLLANKINEILDFLDEQFKEEECCESCKPKMHKYYCKCHSPAPQEKDCKVCKDYGGNPPPHVHPQSEKEECCENGKFGEEHKCRKAPPDKQDSWEEEFEKRFVRLGEDAENTIFRFYRLDYPPTDNREMKEFFRQTLSSAIAKERAEIQNASLKLFRGFKQDGRKEEREEIVGKISKMECPIKKNHPEECHFPIALDEVLKLLK